MVVRGRPDVIAYVAALCGGDADVVELEPWWRRLLPGARRVAMVVAPETDMLPLRDADAHVPLSLVAVACEDLAGVLVDLARRPSRDAGARSRGVRHKPRRGTVTVVTAAMTGALSAVLFTRPENGAPRVASPPTATTSATFSPPARGGAAATWDRAHDELVLFGGVGLRDGDAGEILDDTWTWHAGVWHLATGASPPPRVGGVAAWDPRRGRVVLGGGFGPGGVGPLTDIWAWDGDHWSVQPPVPGPDLILLPAMTTTPAAGIMLLTASRPAGARALRGSTWSWTGSGWLAVDTTSPALTSTASMVGDGVHGDVLMVETAASPAHTGGQTWSFGGMRWALRASAGPAPFDPLSAVLGDDGRRGVPVLFQSPAGGGPLTMTWDWAASRWTAAPSHPSPATAAALVTDDLGELLLFGGPVRGDLTEVWRWSGTAWDHIRYASAVGPDG